MKSLRNNFGSIITIGFLLVSFSAIFIAPHITHAQNPSAYVAPSAGGNNPSAYQAPASGGNNPSAYVPPQSTPQAGSLANVKPPDTNISASTRMGQAIGNMILWISSGVTYLGGTLLESSINNFIIEAGTILRGPVGLSIENAWKLIRDISNLAFIFGFIYIGIRTIIDADNSNTKRMLSQIIIGALLINFSLYFTKVIIDASNYISVEVYNALKSGSGGVAAKIADIMGITTIWKPLSSVDAYAKLTAGGNFAFYFMGGIFLMVAGFVFAAGAILIIIRFVVLIFIMVFSPILFAATVFPNTAELAQKLWKQLFNYAFFAPAYIILLMVSIKILEGFAKNMTGSFSDALAGITPQGGTAQTDFYGVILNFFVIIMFLIISLQVAQKFGVAGGNHAVAIGNNLRGRGQRMLGSATLGVAGGAGRATFGRLGNYISDKDGIKDAASRRGFTGMMARQALKASRGAADASFDARNVAGVGGKLGIGEGRKGGYQTVQKEIEEKESKFAKSLGEVEDTDVQVTARKKEWEHAQKSEKAEVQSLRSKLRDLKTEEYKEGATDDEKQAVDNKNKEIQKSRLQLQDKIDSLEKATKDAQTDYEKEKQRRIIGSTFAPETDDIKAKKDAVKEQKEKIKELWKSYTEMEKDKRTIEERDNIKTEMEALEKEEKALYALRNQQGDRGYAGTLEDSSKWKFLTTPLTGRLVHQNRKAGKEVRKAAEKGLPKKKDD